MTRDEAIMKLEELKIEVAARESLQHRMLGVIEHLVLYITDDGNDGRFPVDPPPIEEPEAN